MSLHGCNDPSIMTSLTGYSELLNDTYPVMKDPPLVEQESEIAYRILQKRVSTLATSVRKFLSHYLTISFSNTRSVQFHH